MIQWKKPSLRLDPTKVILLAMKIRRNVGAHEGEERGNGEGFVTVTDDLEVDGVVVEKDTEPRDDGVYGDHP